MFLPAISLTKLICQIWNQQLQLTPNHLLMFLNKQIVRLKSVVKRMGQLMLVFIDK